MKKQTITISVRLVKNDVALARDRLVSLGLDSQTNTISDILRNTFYAGMSLMNNLTGIKTSKLSKTPSKESIEFIHNLRRKKSTGITNVWVDELIKDKEDVK